MVSFTRKNRESNADEGDSWKLKYYDSLDELERKEAHWQKLETKLYRNMGQLALVSYGSDPDLDRSLDALRELLRRESDQAKIEGAIGGLHAIRRRSENAPGVPGTPVTQSQEHPAPSAAELASHFVAELSRAVTAPTLEALARELAGPQPRALAIIAEEATAAFAQARSSQPMPLVDDAPDTAGLLRDLLDRLDLPESLARKEAEVRARLEGPLEVADFPPIVATIANLVAEVRRELQAQRVEIEGFLLGVNRRLQEIGSFLDETQAGRAKSDARGKSLREGVNDEVAGMRADVSKARDFTGLKTVVNDRLENISLHVERHLHAEEAQSAALTESVHTLRHQLQASARETQTLRNDLTAAQSKAEHDGLTGLYNRAAFDRRAAEAFAEWQRDAKPLSLMVWDVDHFKRINDTYGHQAGDRVLKAIGALLRSRVREADFVARYGGEEIVILMPDTSCDAAAEVAEQLRATLEAARFRYASDEVRVTASCGLTEFRPGDSPESAFQRADEALYAAKSGGRNCARAA